MHMLKGIILVIRDQTTICHTIENWISINPKIP
jgi:hypothetical protein